MFDKHKEDIRTALDVHTAAGVIVANKKLDGLGVHLTQMVRKMEGFFQGVDPHERDMQKFIHDSGGAEECTNNEIKLRMVLTMSGEISLGPSLDLTGIKELLNIEVAKDVDKAFKENMTSFLHELRAQWEQLTDVITATGEHVIDVLSGAACSAKILDGVGNI
jgi:hypothetical protein